MTNYCSNWVNIGQLDTQLLMDFANIEQLDSQVLLDWVNIEPLDCLLLMDWSNIGSHVDNHCCYWISSSYSQLSANNDTVLDHSLIKYIKPLVIVTVV